MSHTQQKGGSALKRLKASLKEANLIGRPSKSAVKRAAKTTTPEERPANPFEIRTTHKKHDVLGRKVKGAIGRPAVSRAKGIEVRKQKLLNELERRNNTSEFVDRRFGETDTSMTLEEKMLERFAKERQKHSNKSTLFNLEDEEELTHLGQSLSGIDDFAEEDLRLDDDDDADDDGEVDENGFRKPKKGQIGEDVVRFHHFGGFGEKPAEGSEQNNEKPKTKKEIMEEIIKKSKLHKYERQKAKEEDDELIRDLDAGLDEIRGLLRADASRSEGKSMLQKERESKQESGESVVTNAASNLDDYDRVVRELIFDAKAKPTDRMKTEEERAREEIERLEQLERDRIRRMRGDQNGDEDDHADNDMSGGGDDTKFTSKKRPISADDLETEYDIDTAKDQRKRAKPIVYEDGVLVGGDFFMSAPKKKKSEDDEGMEGMAGSDDENDEDEEDEDGDDDDEGEEEEEEDGEDDNDEEDEEEDDADDVAEDDLDASDLELDDSKEPRQRSVRGNVKSANGEEEKAAKEEKKSDAAASRAVRISQAAMTESIRKAAARELPYVFPCPTSHQDLLHLVKGRSIEEQNTLLQRVRTLYNVKAKAENRQKMEAFYVVLMEHLHSLAGETPLPLEEIVLYGTELIEISVMVPETAVEDARQRITDFEAELNRNLQENKSSFPSLETIFGLRCIMGIFPTSDFRHPIITPTALLISKYLALGIFSCEQDLISALMLLTLALDFHKSAKRLVPEAINMIAAMLSLFAPKQPDSHPSLFSSGALQQAQTVFGNKLRLKPADLPSGTLLAGGKLKLRTWATANASDFSSGEFRYQAVRTLLSLLIEFLKLYVEVPSAPELMQPFEIVFEWFSKLKETPGLKDLFVSLRQVMDSAKETSSSRGHLQLQRHRPVPLPSLAPKFEKDYSLERKYVSDPDLAESQKLRKAFKKEKKGALRELRRDAAFLSLEQSKRRKEKDAAYKSKINAIMGSLAAEQSEANTEKRKSRKEF